MNNTKFVKKIKLSKGWLYNEMKYKSDLGQIHKDLMLHLEKIEELLKLSTNRQLHITQEIVQEKINLLRTITDLNQNIEQSNKRIESYSMISKHYETIYPLG